MSNQENLAEANIRVIGDTSTVTELITLLAGIRHAIQNKSSAEIKVEIGKRVNSDFFNFTVNNSEIRDYITQSKIQIN